MKDCLLYDFVTITANDLRVGDVALCCHEASGRQGYGACTLLVAGFSFIFN
jgi:hypothetical protein